MVRSGHYSILLAGTAHPYTVRHSRRARRVLLQVHPRRGIELVLPRHASLSQAQRFLHSKQDWLRRIIGRATAASLLPQLVDGVQLPLLGRHITLRVISAPQRLPTHGVGNDEELVVSAASILAVRKRVRSWYREHARTYFKTVSSTLAGELGVPVQAITIRDQTTRWGSCSGRGTLSYNWRLMLAPVQVARYVAAHEVAHLQHRHHQPAFWRTVAQLHPTYTADRTWLRRYGNSLRTVDV